MIVGIRGSGIAATGCAHLLGEAGLKVTRAPVERSTLPTVMLSAQTVMLMRDVFDRPDLFAGRPQVTRRVVAWGDAAPSTVRHASVLMSEAEVQAELAGQQRAVAENSQQVDYRIFAAPPLPEGALHIFGERHAVAVRVDLRDLTSREECRVEAVEAGWLFLVPAGADEPGTGWLMGVGAPLDALLKQSRIIAPVVNLTGAPSVPFLASPRLHMPLCGRDWLACGTAALGFDPICGDGTAQSVREAILASAVLAEIDEGGDADALMAHYQSILIAATRRHLSLCASFYRSGGDNAWWRSQFEALMEGHEWCTRLLATMPEPQYMLRGFRLVSRQEAA